MIEKLVALFKKPASETKNETPEGVCPNCWGREEYGGQFYEAIKNRGIDATHPEKNADRFHL